jgi:hypothetical protein
MKIRLLILTCLFLTTAAQEEQANKSVIQWAKNRQDHLGMAGIKI